MSWRIHVSEGAIKRLDILSGKPSLVAVWLSNSQIAYYDLQTGIKKTQAALEQIDLRDRALAPARKVITSLQGPNQTFLPFVRFKGGAIYTSSDGTRRLFYLGGRDLYFEADGEESRLALEPEDTAEDRKSDIPLVAVSMDRAGVGVSATLDAKGNLTLFKDRVRTGTYPIPLTPNDEMRPLLHTTRGSSAAILTDGHRLLAVDTAGRVRAQAELHFTIGALACSSDGKRVVVTDLDANIIRVYTGALIATHQRFAVDLLAESRRAQLEAIPEAGRAALGAVAINSKGVVAFGLASTLCITGLARLSAIPRPAV